MCEVHHDSHRDTGRSPAGGLAASDCVTSSFDTSDQWLCPICVRALRGDDSDPGLLVFTLRAGADGYPFHDLQVL